MKKKEIQFYRVEDEYGCFSNFSAHPIFAAGQHWPTVEHYFQAQKFKDYKLSLLVLGARTPGEAAKIGRNKNNPLREDWEQVKDGVMKQGVRAKIIRHWDVRKTLLSTWDTTLIEHTKNDSYWGDGGDGSGENRLGKILMEIREEIMPLGDYDELKTIMLPLWLKFPNIPRRSIGWRMGYGEGYLDDFLPWFLGLSPESKKRYKEIFPEPEGWKDWYVQVN